MYIPKDCFIYVNIVVAIIFLIYVFKSYKNGFIYELVNLAFLLLSVACAWLVSPILAKNATIYDASKVVENNLPAENLNVLINTIIWFVLILIVLNVIFLLIKPLLKFFSKIPVLGTVNKVLGGIIGILYALFVSVIISMILTFPIFKNGKEVVDGTILKYANSLNKAATKLLIQNIDLSEVANHTEDFDVDKARKELQDWLIEQGVIDG